MSDEIFLSNSKSTPMYGQIMEQHPNWILVGAETASCVTQWTGGRGMPYPRPANSQVAAMSA